jgi:hypothetical protein
MNDERRDGPPPLHLGDYPHGAYWSADRAGAERLRDTPDRPPWVTSTPRSAENPYPLRMFAETGCDFALWGPLGEPPPTTNGIENAHQLEDVLPISASLRDRLLKWGRAYETFDLDGEEHDERGYYLSRELKLELGDLYSVTYSLTFAGPHREVLRSRARDEPLPGWTLLE